MRVPRPTLFPGTGLGPLAAVLGILAATWGCGTDKAVPTGPSAPPDPSATFSRVQREIFTPSCALAGCHAGSSPQLALSLEAGRAYASLVGVGSAETSLLRVAPSLPNDSYLVVKIRGDAAILGSRMPLTGGPLSSPQVQLVVDWVRRGAPND